MSERETTQWAELADELDDQVAEFTAALEIAEQQFEQIRLTLVRNLDEPERTAFWTAVRARDAIRALLARAAIEGEG